MGEWMELETRLDAALILPGELPRYAGLPLLSSPGGTLPPGGVRTMELVTTTVYSPGDTPGVTSLDQILVEPSLGLLAVADAATGGSDGAAGVRIALDNVRNHVERHADILNRFRRHATDDLRARILTVLEEAFSRAAHELFAFARRRKGLLITLDVVLLLRHEAFVGHVGDGRVYLVRRGLVHQLTVDHSRGDEAIVFSKEDVPPEAMTASPERRFTRALGPQPRVRVESMTMELAPEDRMVVTSAHLPRVLADTLLHRHLVRDVLDRLGPELTRAAAGRPLVAVAAQLGSGDPSRDESAQQRLNMLSPMPMFAHCTARELRHVAAATRPRTHKVGQVIFSQGDPGKAVYLLISGKVRIEKDGVAIITLGPGSNFGEMAMLDEPQRSATAVAAEDCELLVIPRDAFFALLRGNPNLAVKILWNLLLNLSAALRRTTAITTEQT